MPQCNISDFFFPFPPCLTGENSSVLIAVLFPKSQELGDLLEITPSTQGVGTRSGTNRAHRGTAQALQLLAHPQLGFPPENHSEIGRKKPKSGLQRQLLFPFPPPRIFRCRGSMKLLSVLF